jgi:acyl carrier protein
VLNVERPSPDTDLITGGLLDSLALVTLLFEIEQEFAVQLSLESLDIEALRDVRRIAVLIDELMAGRVGPSSAARSHRQ